MTAPVVLPSGWCQYCYGEDSAKLGYGVCPYCGGSASLDRLEWEVDELTGKLEDAERQVEVLIGDKEELQRQLNNFTKALKEAEIASPGSK